MDINTVSEFFLGCNTSQGFVGHLKQLTSPNKFDTLYLLKGGAGSGKSTIMKAVAQRAIDLSEKVELIRCSSDIESLDGVILWDRKVAIFDGTLPHAIEPQFVGVFEEIVNLTAAFDRDGLRSQREEIIAMILHNKTLHARCVRYLCGANSVLDDSYRMAFEATDFAKIKRAASLLASKILAKEKGAVGTEEARILSAVTNNGYTLLPMPNYKTYTIEDPFGVVTNTFLQEIKQLALRFGYDVVGCYSPFAPFERLDHLIIPKAGVFFTCNNIFHTPSCEAYKIISYKRFTSLEALRIHKKRIAFNKKAARAMVEQAGRSILDAKANHDLIEQAYRPYIRFEVIDKIKTQLMNNIFQDSI